MSAGLISILVLLDFYFPPILVELLILLLDVHPSLFKLVEELNAE